MKAFSIDFWRTLAVSNKQFSIKRAELFSQLLGVPVNQVSFNIERIGKLSDGINVNGGVCSALSMFELLLEFCGKTGIDVGASDLQKRSNELFVEYPPLLIPETIDFIQKVVGDGAKCNLSSNTGYVEGEEIKKFLFESEISGLLEFMLFSDEIQVSKPSSIFFEEVVNQYGDIYDIIHIGDDIYTDVYGAVRFGIPAFHFGSMPLSFENIENHVLRTI